MPLAFILLKGSFKLICPLSL